MILHHGACNDGNVMLNVKKDHIQNWIMDYQFTALFVSADVDSYALMPMLVMTMESSIDILFSFFFHSLCLQLCHDIIVHKETNTVVPALMVIS